MKIEEIQVDPPRSLEARVRVLYASLCHTDIVYYRRGSVEVLIRIQFISLALGLVCFGFVSLSCVILVPFLSLCFQEFLGMKVLGNFSITHQLLNLSKILN